MSFMERRISEYKTAPDVRRVRFGGDKSRRPRTPLVKATSKGELPGAPVLERRKMFEQSESAIPPPVAAGTGFGSVSGRRGSKQRSKDISRSTSFRGTKRLKDESQSPVLGRAKQLGMYNNSSVPMWKKLRNFGHFDLQSIAIDTISTAMGNQEEHNVKKPTGASAAHGDSISTENAGHSNTLVSCCPAFTNEVGGDGDWLSSGNPILLLRESLSVDKQRRVGSRERMILDGELPLKSMVLLRGPMNRQVSQVLLPMTGMSYPFEFIDYGASYYRNYFLHLEHQNFFGVDENLGPIAISIRREKVPEQLGNFYNLQPNPAQPPPKHQYRVIFRTSELSTLRGILLEESVPTGAKTGTSKGIPPRDIVEYVSQGEVQMSCLKLGKSDKKVLQELVRLDEQELNNKYKVGIIYCKPGQETEEDMYNNESGSPAFDEFLELMGQKVRMKGFNKYRAQLDNKTDTTGEYSVYTEYRDAELMFHVSTLLPHTASNKQQLLRKRHIGNDIVTIIFQEPGCGQFSPRCIRSHFQHIFVIVRVENPNTKYTKYRVAVSRSTDISFFGPLIPEGAVFDKNDNFRDFILTKVVNACNASLRNKKFSAMAIRTRKQYLNDLAEQSTTSTTIDQANTSGRVAGLLRNLGHKKKERMRQDSTLVYTGGALTWHVSIIFREKKPLPFSEDHDNHIECIMGIGPDMLVFLDYFTKYTLLHIPTKDLSGWIVDKKRMNLFYDNSHCLSLDCLESEDDVRELITRMQAVAPRLTSSHEACLMDFRRSTTGFLGFTINEAGVVERVDGLAKNSGLQSNSRLLQVEDRLLCCHSHKQITELLTNKEKLFVRAYVIPPPPPSRHLLFYPEVNWAGVWASRPTHSDLEESVKVSNGVEHQESQQKQENGVKVEVEKRKKKLHIRSHSHANRLSYMEAIQTNEGVNNAGLPPNLVIDDNEPIYDRLGETSGGGVSKIPRSPTQPQRGGNFRRVKGPHNRTTRESVLNLADDMERRQDYVPTPMEHTVSEVDIKSPIQLTTSEQLPDRKPHTAAPLGPHHRRSGSHDLKKETLGGVRKPAIEVTSPLTPKGIVREKMNMFSYSSSSSSPSRVSQQARHAGSSGSGNTPMRALASTSEMTKSKSKIPTMTTTSGGVSMENSRVSNVKMRKGSNKKAGKTRPASFDVSLLLNNEKNMAETSKDDSCEAGEIFDRNMQIRTAFRKKSYSREPTPELDEEEMNAAGDFAQPLPRSPTTGALISGGGGGGGGGDEVFSPSQEAPGLDELGVGGGGGSGEKQLSQNTSSQGSRASQDSVRKIHKMTVRERTKKWEARGGGLPSYFSTLPKSFRHKATDPRQNQAYMHALQSPTGEEQAFFAEDEEAFIRKISSTSQSGIPLPASKLRPPRTTSSSGGRGGGHDKSMSPGRGDEGENSSGQYPSSNESSLELRMGIGQEDGERHSAGKGRSFTGKGSHLPMRSSGLQVSSKRTGQPIPDRVSSPISDSDPSKPPRPPASLPGSSSSGGRHSGIPLKTSLSSDRGLHPNHHSNARPSARENQTRLDSQASGDSLEENFLELDRNLNDLLQRDPRRDRAARKADAHIEEWLRQTSNDAVPPDMLLQGTGDGVDGGGGVGGGQRDLGSPTFTDNSLNYSQTSEYTQEVIDSLRAKVGHLETQLNKESEHNSDLRSKLTAAERKLQNAESRKSQRAVP